MHTSLRGGGIYDGVEVRRGGVWFERRARHCWVRVRERIQSNSSIASVGTLCSSIVRGSKK